MFKKPSISAEDEPQAALYSPLMPKEDIPSKNSARHRYPLSTPGTEVSDTERRLFALPHQYRGLAISNPVKRTEKVSKI